MVSSDFVEQSQLIRLYLRCALDPTLWSPTLKKLCDSLEGIAPVSCCWIFWARATGSCAWGPTTTWSERMGRRARLGQTHPSSVLGPDRTTFGRADHRRAIWLRKSRLHHAVYMSALPHASPGDGAVALSEPPRLGLLCVTRTTARVFHGGAGWVAPQSGATHSAARSPL